MQTANQEFVKAIMSVLRLESNIYTIGAIEKIVDRLQSSDYPLFIAYLGERKSDYEKPIESIAKGVDEYYEIKLKPYKLKSEETARRLSKAIIDIKTNTFKNCINLVDKKSIEEEIRKEYTIADESVREYHIENNIRSEAEKIYLDKIKNNLINSDKLKNSFEAYVIRDTKERILSDKDISILFDIGLDKFQDEYCIPYDIIFEFIYTKNLKPKITDKILIAEAKKAFSEDVIDSKVKHLIKYKNHVEWSE